jgi:iron uptake system component EfeO
VLPRAAALLLASLPVAALLSGCGSGEGTSAGSGKITVAADDSSCTPSTRTAAAGASTFSLRNSGSKVSELYVYAPGDRIVGEVEQIGPGITRDLTVQLQPGQYQLACKPGMTGDGIRAAFTVTGAAAPSGGADPRLAAAVTRYRSYVGTQSKDLLKRTQAFAAAVQSGDVARAKALYAGAREPYERIEPVAEALGDLDPEIDAREGDVPVAEWGGFHRIEKALWAQRSTAGQAPVAAQLVEHVRVVQTQAASAELTPSSLGNGANELLSEVATSKVTGEEERYSHTDLWDFQANVDGADAAYQALRPVLLDKDRELTTSLDDEFAATDKALAQFRRGAGWVSYDTVTPAQRKVLSDQVAALSEPLSKLTAAVVR